MALATKPRWDKTNPYVGNHRAHLAADVAEVHFNQVLAVGKNSQGAVVIGGGQTGVDGVMIIAVGQDIHGELLDGGINNMAGDPTDVGQLGEITNFQPYVVGVAPANQAAPKAGTIYYGHPDGSVTDATGPGAVVVGRTAEKDRLIVNVNLSAPSASIQNTAPIGLAGAGGTGTATLTWVPVKGASGYKIQKSTDNSTFAAGAPATSVNPTVTETGLTSGAANYFKVLATVGGVDSAYSQSVQVTVL